MSTASLHPSAIQTPYLFPKAATSTTGLILPPCGHSPAPGSRRLSLPLLRHCTSAPLAQSTAPCLLRPQSPDLTKCTAQRPTGDDTYNEPQLERCSITAARGAGGMRREQRDQLQLREECDGTPHRGVRTAANTIAQISVNLHCHHQLPSRLLFDILWHLISSFLILCPRLLLSHLPTHTLNQSIPFPLSCVSVRVEKNEFFGFPSIT